MQIFKKKIARQRKNEYSKVTFVKKLSHRTMEKIVMNLTNVFKKFVTAGSLTLLLSPGLASAQNAYGDTVTCAGSYTSCYDFTVYDGTKIAANTTGTSSNKGFFEGFVTYSGSGSVTPILSNAYFISTGLASPGATASSWASYVSNPSMYGAYDGATGAQSGTATLNTATGRFASDNNISFQVGATYYAVTLGSNGSAQIYYSSTSAEDALAGNQQLGRLAYSYTSTNVGANSINTAGNGNFGGQIAPEMSPLMSFNVFALLGCLFLLLTSKKYFVRSKPNTLSDFSIA